MIQTRWVFAIDDIEEIPEKTVGMILDEKKKRIMYVFLQFMVKYPKL